MAVNRKDRTFEVNKLLIIWLLLCFCRLLIGPWVLRENNAIELANQSLPYIGKNTSHMIKDIFFYRPVFVGDKTRSLIG